MNKYFKDLYIFFDSECLMCNRFIRFFDKNYENNFKNNFKNIFLVSDVKKIKGIFKENLNINLLGSLQKKTIMLVFSNGEIVVRSKAIAYLFSLSSKSYLNLIGKFITIIPLFIADSIYKIISRNRRFFFSSSKCNLYLPKNIILIK